MSSLKINLVIEQQNDDVTFAVAFDIKKIQQVSPFVYVIQTEPAPEIKELIGEGAGPYFTKEEMKKIKPTSLHQ